MNVVMAGALVLSLAVAAAAQTPAAAPGKPGELPLMETYYLVMLVKGPKWTSGPPPELMTQHRGHLRKMAAAGKLVLAGPLADDGTVRGLAVYKVATLEEARSLASEDPTVKAGHFAVEAHPWMVQKGILP